MDFYELRNKYFSQVQRKMINDYKMGNIDFMKSEELIDTIIERIGVYQDNDKSENDSIVSAFKDYHKRLLALRPTYYGLYDCWHLTMDGQRSQEQNMCRYSEN